MYNISSDIKLNIPHKALTVAVINPFLSLLFLHFLLMSAVLSPKRFDMKHYLEWHWQHDWILPPPPYLYNMACSQVKIKNVSELCFLTDRLSEFKQSSVNLPQAVCFSSGEFFKLYITVTSIYLHFHCRQQFRQGCYQGFRAIPFLAVSPLEKMQHLVTDTLLPVLHNLTGWPKTYC